MINDFNYEDRQLIECEYLRNVVIDMLNGKIDERASIQHKAQWYKHTAMTALIGMGILTDKLKSTSILSGDMESALLAEIFSNYEDAMLFLTSVSDKVDWCRRFNSGVTAETILKSEISYNGNVGDDLVGQELYTLRRRLNNAVEKIRELSNTIEQCNMELEIYRDIGNTSKEEFIAWKKRALEAERKLGDTDEAKDKIAEASLNEMINIVEMNAFEKNQELVKSGELQRKIHDDDKQVIINLYLKGKDGKRMTYGKIAKLFGVSDTTIRNILIDAGVYKFKK